jgi:hypothetical protein
MPTESSIKIEACKNPEVEVFIADASPQLYSPGSSLIHQESTPKIRSIKA